MILEASKKNYIEHLVEANPKLAEAIIELYTSGEQIKTFDLQMFKFDLKEDIDHLKRKISNIETNTKLIKLFLVANLLLILKLILIGFYYNMA